MVRSGLALGSDGSVFVTSADAARGGVARYSAQGELLWFVDLPAGAAAQPLVTADGGCIVRGRDGTIFALAGDGAIAWSLPLGHPMSANGGVPVTSVVPGANGELLVRVDHTANP